MKTFKITSGVPLEKLNERLYNELHMLFELFIILYADDTVLMSETKEGMQQSLNIFQLYCDLWKLDVNINKTKIMVFSKKRNLNYSFILQDKQLEVVEKFSYLGIIFRYNGTFFDTKKKLVDQAQRSLHFIYKTIKNESIPVDLQLKLFDSMIEPILLYSSEVWGYENLKILKQIHLKFYKFLFCIKKGTNIFKNNT
jgi:hypothetical protein